MGIKIVADRIIDLTDEELKSLGISTISVYIHLGEKSYEDLIDISVDDTFAFTQKNKTLPKTAARSVEDYYDFFKKFVDKGDEVVHIAASSKISSICQNAMMAAEMFNGKVFVVDSKNLSNGLAIIAKHALELLKSGKYSAAEIAENCRDLTKRVSGSFLITDLEHLHKGGRCKSLTYYAGSLLKIKPIIVMGEDGVMKMSGFARGKHAKALVKYVSTILEKNPTTSDTAYFVYTNFNEQLLKLLEGIAREKFHFTNVYFNKTSCNSAVHSGQHTYGIFYLKD